MEAKTKTLTLRFCEETGSLLELSAPEKRFTCSQSDTIALFRLRMVDEKGGFIETNAFDADRVAVSRRDRAEGSLIRLDFTGFNRLPGLSVTATAALETGRDRILWGLSIGNHTDYAIEYADFPRFAVPDDLGPGPDHSRIFWPYTEGCLIEDIDRPRFTESPLTYPSGATESMYPGAVTMQYMAYYDRSCGLYFAAHDARPLPKAIECFRERDGIRMSFKAFCCVAPHTDYALDHPMVMELFQGDWMDAADLYARFIQDADFPLPPKNHDNELIPAWQRESPVVVIFPPRSVRGTGYMGPNEFFPYGNAEKYLYDLAQSIDSRLLAFLTYWEGSAPWCPPYIWPPYGGEEGFRAFVDALHAGGHAVGVYGSGLHWTDQSLLCPEFDRSREREELGLTGSMCAGPDGTLSSRICQSIRRGYDMCPACEPTARIALDQFASILDAGVDFVQYFDQNIGGRGYACYSDEHGHPPLYGPWSVEAMRGIYSSMTELMAARGHRSAIGCESSPADCFLRELTFNDLRYNWVFSCGRPVPAFEYVFHEYSVNFMGNQCAFTQTIPADANPDTLLFRLAYSLMAGDLLTLVIKSGGEIHWEWGMSWLQPGPRQHAVIAAVRDYAAMRRGPGYSCLHLGRMLRPAPVRCGEGCEMTRADGTRIGFDGILSSKWRAPDGSEVQFLANYREQAMDVTMEGSCLSAFDARGGAVAFRLSGEGVALRVPPLSCVGLVTKDPAP